MCVLNFVWVANLKKKKKFDSYGWGDLNPGCFRWKHREVLVEPQESWHE